MGNTKVDGWSSSCPSSIKSERDSSVKVGVAFKSFARAKCGLASGTSLPNPIYIRLLPTLEECKPDLKLGLMFKKVNGLVISKFFYITFQHYYPPATEFPILILGH